MNVVIFIGPTISGETASQYLDASYLPPAAQGDVFAAAKQSPDVIGIVDGYFHRVPSVWHKEVLWAMSQGIHVFGSASMGALRAAELDAFGMVGVGRIFEDYRSEKCINDDEVAVIHGPAELGYPALSQALANIRASLTLALAKGIVCQATHDDLIALAENTFFPERSYANLLEKGRTNDLSSRELDALEAWLPDHQIDQKQDDAIAMLKHIADFVAGNPGRKDVHYHVENTYLFDDHV